MLSLKDRAYTTEDFHQGSERFSVLTRGRQCVPNGLVFVVLATHKSLLHFTRNDLNFILTEGDVMYRNIQQNGNVQSDYLAFSDLPSNVSFGPVTYSLNNRVNAVVYSGNLKTQLYYIDSYTMSLEFALNLAFYSSVQNKGCILIFCDSAIAIVKEKNELAVFNSHSRSVSGLCEPDGTCIISFYENIKTLCTFIRSLCHFMSNRQLDLVQYDLHCVNLRHSRSRSDTFNISKPKKSVTCCKQNCSESTDLDKVDKEYMYKAIKTKKTLKQRTFALKASKIQDTIFSIGSKNSSGDKKNSTRLQKTTKS